VSERGRYGLPLDVRFCKRCVISTQRFSSTVERNSQPEEAKDTIAFDDEGVCSACRYVERKAQIDWAAREAMLVALLDKHRDRKPYNVIVPGSGGKDSMYVAHMLKHRYGMTPLTITGSPIIYTDIGRKNFDAWCRLADNVLYTPHDYRERTRDAFLRFLHPFKPFIEEQVHAGPRLSKQTGIPLVFYGEPRAERGNDPRELDTPIMDAKFYPEAGPDTEVHYFGWYHFWKTQANFYYAVENCGFQPNTERTIGTYSKMSSLDDAVDFAHYHTTAAKTGLGRASYNAVDDIRDGYIDREEAVALVKRYDHEWPGKWIDIFCEYIGITVAEYKERVDEGRSAHLWQRVDGAWQLKPGCAVWHA
jgi:hypothetical protein